MIENLKNNDYMNDVLGYLNMLPEKFAQMDCDSVELPFEKEKSDFLVPQKMINLLKIFKPIKFVDSYFRPR